MESNMNALYIHKQLSCICLFRRAIEGMNIPNERDTKVSIQARLQLSIVHLARQGSDFTAIGSSHMLLKVVH